MAMKTSTKQSLKLLTDTSSTARNWILFKFKGLSIEIHKWRMTIYWGFIHALESFRLTRYKLVRVTLD